jgi:hypothetical protein
LTPQIKKLHMKISAIILLLVCGLARDADAYVDPGTTGMLSQLLYVLFYGALAIFLYSLRHVKQMMSNLRRYLFKGFPKKTE